MKDSYEIEAILYKGDDEEEALTGYTGDDFTGAVMGSKALLDEGKADSVVFYIAKDGELIDMFSRDATSMDVKEVTVAINETMEHYGG